jgi:hypothetical protein
VLKEGVLLHVLIFGKEALNMVNDLAGKVADAKLGTPAGLVRALEIVGVARELGVLLLQVGAVRATWEPALFVQKAKDALWRLFNQLETDGVVGEGNVGEVDFLPLVFGLKREGGGGGREGGECKKVCAKGEKG